MSDTAYCNWTFNECLTPYNKWLVDRDCSDDITLSRGSSKNWEQYQLSLQPRYVGQEPISRCPSCSKAVNGVNPSDDGETWRM